MNELNREAWLAHVGQIIERDLFKPNNIPINPFKVSTGFPSGGSALKRIGECWFATSTRDNVAQIFINPTQDDSSRVVDILIHEMIHVAYPTAGHKGSFKQAAKAVGLTGKMTATIATDKLNLWIKDILAVVGPYPHAQIMINSRKKQGTRMIKMECSGCGYVARTSQKWIIERGAVLCPCNELPMRLGE